MLLFTEAEHSLLPDGRTNTMIADEQEELPLPFQWGGYVRVRSNATERYSITEGWACGVRRIENAATAIKVGTVIGSLLLLVEGTDGKAIEIPIEYLEVG
jgi:hypothetical protein